MEVEKKVQTVLRKFRRVMKGEISLRRASEKVLNRQVTLVRRIKTLLFGDVFDKNFARRKFYMDHNLRTSHPKEVKQVFDALGSRNGRIIIYPSAIHWKPLQRPQQLLKELGKNGAICFFCEEDGSEHFTIEEKFPNVFCVNKEVVLIEALREYSVVFYITWAAQALMAQYFLHKYLWYDIVDSLETFSFGKTKGYRQMHQSLLDLAHLVTYSARSLNPRLSKSLYIPNGVDLSAFSERTRPTLPNTNIIYVGAIDLRWFDVETLKYTARNLPNEKIYLIGKLPNTVKKLPKNIIPLGFIDYDELSQYLANAKVGIIPFKKNGITETVLPCKLFEYSAMGLPTVSTGLPEVGALKKTFLVNVNTREAFLAEIKSALASNHTSKKLRSFAENYSWAYFAHQIDTEISKSILGLTTLGNVTYQNTINIPSYTFFDSEGGNFFSGGAERYLIDLHNLALKMGHKLRVLQKGAFNWIRYYGDLEVVGISSNEHKMPDDAGFTSKVISLTEGRSLLNIYSPFSLIYPHKFSPSIGISHGVYWDNPFDQGKLDEYLVKSASLVDTMISVDTNTPNWYQTRDYQLGSSIMYVPNYVDLHEFSVQKRKFGESGRVVIVYPRRLYEPRGLYIVLDVLNEILTKYPNVEFHFVGKGNPQDTDKVLKYIKKWGNRVRWYSKAPDKMFEVYQMADIVLVPTLYSEGTSLSCLEALASGNVVVATRIGGLVNLVIDGFNGYLIEPHANSLKQKLEEILNSHKSIDSIKKQARKTAESFNKEIWNARWQKLIESKVSTVSAKQVAKRDLIAKRVELEFANRKEFLQNFASVATLLKSGATVFVRSRKKDLIPSTSYGRLQLIK